MTGRDLRRTSLSTILAATLALPAGARAEAPGGEAPGPAGRIVFQVVPVVSGDRHGVTTSLSAVPVLASSGAPLLGGDLYLAVGRADLAAEHQARQSRRTTLAVVGGGLVLGGLAYAATRPGPGADLPFDQFRNAMDEQSRGQTQGMVISLGGGALLAVAALLDPNPVDEAERQRLIEVHNRALGGGSGEAGQAAGAGLSFDAGLRPGGAVARVGLAF